MDTKLSKGDWIVHTNYGLGQVLGEDKKVLGGEEREYYKVQTQAATYWLPKNRVDAENVRQVSSKKSFRMALDILKQKPKKMDKDYRKRRSTISEVIATNSVVEFARLIRDLYYRRRKKSLNEHENQALHTLKTRFIREWSLAADIGEDEASAKLEKTLSEVIPA